MCIAGPATLTPPPRTQEFDPEIRFRKIRRLVALRARFAGIPTDWAKNACGVIDRLLFELLETRNDARPPAEARADGRVVAQDEVWAARESAA